MKRSFVTFSAMVVVLILMSTYLPAMAQQAATAAITVDEAKLGKDVKDRQIIDETADFALQDKVFLWVKVTGAAGETLKVTWKNGDHTYTSDLAVTGTPWRTWCYKIVALAGDWTVSIADSKGTALKDLSFKVK
jgi:hypothetical protein